MKLTRKDILFIAICIGAAALVVIAAHFLWPPGEPEAHLDEVVDVAKYSYVASVNSEVFHSADCRYVDKISPHNIVSYETREQFLESGRRPCKVCRP